MKNYFNSFLTFLLLILFVGHNIAHSNSSLTAWLNANDDCFVINKDRNLKSLIPWAFSESTFMAITCPSNTVINLGPGECGRVHTFGFAPTVFTPVDLTFNQLQNPNTVNASTYCGEGQTKYSRKFLQSGSTDIRVKSIQVGVYFAINQPTITINIYDQLDELLGTQQFSVPNFSAGGIFNAVFTNTTKIEAGTEFRLELVANAPGISIFKMGRNTGGYLDPLSQANFDSDICGTVPNMSDGAINANAIVLGMIGTPDMYKMVDSNNNPKSGEVFPIGVNNMNYLVTDANGVSTTCAFSIDVREYNSSISLIACNDLVQVSLDENCELIITPEMLLQGGGYGCFDKFTVNITDKNGKSLKNKVTGANLGQTLKTTITGPNGNSCWGEIFIQDKAAPNLMCRDVYATCNTDLTPGSLMSEKIPVAAVIVDGTLSAATANAKTFNIPVHNLFGDIITDLNVFLDIEHARLSDLAIEITSPDGMTSELINLSSSVCTGQNLMITLDDEAMYDNTALNTVCEATIPAITGMYKPKQSLAMFDGKTINGTWKVKVYDLVPGIGGEVKHIDLVFSQKGAIIPFPTDKDVTFIQLSEETFALEGFDNCGTATLQYSDQVEEQECTSIYTSIIERCWIAKDEYGAESNSCCQKIYVYRTGLSSLTFPPNFDGHTGNEASLSCLTYGNSLPPVSVTGLPSGSLCDNVQIATPTDVTIEICKNSYKLIRTHKVIDWCTGQIILHNQIIKVEDNQGPELKCQGDVTISSDEYKCTATYQAPKPEILAECSDILTYHLSYLPQVLIDGDFITTNVNQSTLTINTLPEGTNIIKWSVTDECGNTGYCTYKVVVEDQVAPNAVCDQHTVASITGGGYAIIEAKTFDDGSHDNCGIAKFEVAKMTNICSTGNLNFGPSVTFCCEEVNTTVTVAFLVTDLSGNTNVCMVDVTVQDKLPPYITKCAPDITLNCQADYTNLAITLEPEYVDNCAVISVKHEDNVKISQCGVGTVTRTWTVADKQGYRASCVQVITLIDNSPFVSSDITWPNDYTTPKCYSLLKPEDLPKGQDRPTFKDDNCSLVAATYKDQTFKFVEGACEKIIRTWTVIDWCTYDDSDPSNIKGIYQDVQIIKLLNDIPPIFEFACEDKTYPVYGVCEGPVDFTMTAIDDCPEDNVNLNWHYDLDLYNDGSINFSASVARLNRTLPIGYHKVVWTVEDKCGNKAFCTQYYTIIESKKPTPYCLSSITTAVMNSNGQISIWAKDYDLGSTDNCTAKQDLIFTFNGATPVVTLLDKEHYFEGNGVLSTLAKYNAGVAQKWIPQNKTSGIVFDCDDIANAVSQRISLDMTVTDLAGNQDYCTITLDLQDNADYCKLVNTNQVKVSGRITTASSLSVSGAEVKIESNFSELNRSVTSDEVGNFTFVNLNKGYNYTVSVKNESNILNGVSTLDLVLIQRHILGLESLSDYSKIVAADVDNNAKVTAADLTALRKVILGITTTFPNNQRSWRFLTSVQSFANNNSPFPFIEKMDFNLLSDNKVNQNFVAVKIGDVNNTAKANSNDLIVEPRTEQHLTMVTKNIASENPNEISVEISASNFSKILGFQGTLEFDPTYVELLRISPVKLDVSDANFGMQVAKQGKVSMSINNFEGLSFGSEDALFTMVFKVIGNGDASDILSLTSTITPSIAFDEEKRLVSMSLRNKTVSGSDEFALLQNRPNPFKDKTIIPFYLPESGSVTLKIFNMTGQLVKTTSSHFEKGENTIEFNTDGLHKSGLMMYQLESGQYLQSKKMLIIE